MNNWLLSTFMEDRLKEDIQNIVLFETVDSAVDNMNVLVDVYNKFFGQEVIRWELKDPDPYNFVILVYVSGRKYEFTATRKNVTLSMDEMKDGENEN